MDDLRLTTTAPITSLHVVVTILKTLEISYAGEYVTFPAGAPAVSHVDSISQIHYMIDLNPGQSIPAGSYTIGVQFSGNGHGHPYDRDGYSVTTTSGGMSTTTSGRFIP